MSEVLAGKIGVTNGGEWNAETYYEEATFVRYQNNLYLSNLPSTGVEPTNEEYWMLAMEGFSGEDVQTLIDSINNIIDGTTQVGNAKTLDGHEAEHFFPKSGGKVSRENSTVIEVNNSKKDSTAVWMTFQNEGVDKGHLGFSGENQPCFKTTGGVNRDLLHAGNFGNYALPIVGGRAQSTNFGESLIIHRSANGAGSALRFDNADGVLGYLGFDPYGKTNFWGANLVPKELLHTGNKPTGTYTGNGDATKREISIGNAVGSTCMITSDKGMVLLSTHGGIGKKPHDTSVTGIGASNASCLSNRIIIVTDNELLNASGVTYTYWYL